MRHMSIDIETYSSVSIRDAGLYKYVQSGDFKVLLFAYSFDGEVPKIVDLEQGEHIPLDVQIALFSPEVVKHAYNAAFEWYCLSKHFQVRAQEKWLNQWRCTMVHGLYCGMIGGLGKVGEALGLPADKQKDRIGGSLIQKFCVPGKNGKPVSPAQEPEKWALFKKYCIQDVVTEMEVERRLSAFPVPDFVQAEWEQDMRVNAAGVRLDMDLAEGAIAFSDAETADLIAQAKALTGLSNPNSPAQLKSWIGDNLGEIPTSLSKAAVEELLEREDLPPKVKAVLELRQKLGKTSVSKYKAMIDCVCQDGRIRGLLQFYGASRTGRWAGRLVQMQNLPRNYIAELDYARDLVKTRRVQELSFVFGNVPDTLSQLIRTAFIPAEGHRFVVADFSAIEARVIAWLAGETWRMQAFAKGEDIYCASASHIFGVPVVKHGENGHLRQKGKIAELACIAEGQLVLTNHGLIPIENVRTYDMLWDGENWVHHDGVIYKGRRRVITYEGLTATPDHLVWVDGESEPIQFGAAAACGAHLVQSGNGGKAVRLGKDHKPGEKVERDVESVLRPYRMHELWFCKVDASGKPDTGTLQRLPEVLPTFTNPKMAEQETHGRKAKVRKCKRSRVLKLRKKRHKIQVSDRNGSWVVFDQNIRIAGSVDGNRQDRRQRGLCTWEYPICDSHGKQSKQAHNGSDRVRPAVLALLLPDCYSEAVERLNERRNHSGRGGRSDGAPEMLEADFREARVYDIRNAGEHHRFTVSGKLVHNCGYGGSVSAMKAMGGSELPDAELKQIVDDWRRASPHIVRLWYQLENAAMDTIRTGRPLGAAGLIFRHEQTPEGLRFLTIRIPSGRKLFYCNPFFAPNRFGNESIHYYGVRTGNWAELETYGGKLTENVVQAIARDCLAVAMKNIEAAGYQIVMHIHDEVILDAPADRADLDTVCKLMCQPIPWAEGLLLNADGFVGDYYKKD